MASINELINLANFKQQNAIESNPLFNFVGGFSEGIRKAQEDLKRQKNNAQAIEQAGRMRQMLEEMPDNSNAGRTAVLLDSEDKKKQRRIGGLSRFIPQFKMEIGPDGTAVTKSGLKLASPTEQKAIIEADSLRRDKIREEEKRNLLDAFIEGRIPDERALLESAADLGITSEDYNSAVSLKKKLESFSSQVIPQTSQNIAQSNQVIPQGGQVIPQAVGANAQATIKQPGEFKATKLERDAFGNLIESGFELDQSQEMALNNVNLVSGALRELAQTYSEAYEEGGIGNIGRQLISEKAQSIGGDIGDKFPATAAFSGQKTEVIARMMPLLTQQGDKPGSVRLVQTVFDKLERTLPAENTGPKSARRMMENTIKNMYRFARASQQLGLTNEFIETVPDSQINEISNKVANIADNIEIEGIEKQALDSLINQSLLPIDNIISGGEGQGLVINSITEVNP